jgi:hypothetical protein
VPRTVLEAIALGGATASYRIDQGEALTKSPKRQLGNILLTGFNAMDPLAEDFYLPHTWYVFGKEVHFRLEAGRVAYVPIDELFERAKSQIQEGDRIIFAAWSGMEIKVNGGELLILREDDVLAVRE